MAVITAAIDDDAQKAKGDGEYLTRRRYMRAATEYLLSKGITAVGDMGDVTFGLGASVKSERQIYSDIFDLYPTVVDGEPFVRIAAAVPLSSVERLTKALSEKRTRRVSDALRIGSVKGFIDGSLGSRTALFSSPYLDSSVDGGEAGMRIEPLELVRQKVLLASKNNLQVIVHAIGDRAVDDVLSIYEEAVLDAEMGAPVGGSGDVPPAHRIEHVQHVTRPAERTAERIARVGAIASVQPLHLVYDRENAESALGVDTASSSSYMFRTMLDRGVRLAFGSDWPVVDADPLKAIHAARFRRGYDADTKEAWLPEQGMSAFESLLAYTRDAAASIEWSDQIGSIEPGKLADFVVWSHDFVSRWDAAGELDSKAPPHVFLSGACVYGCRAQ